jgi:hypothetical protein
VTNPWEGLEAPQSGLDRVAAHEAEQFRVKSLLAPAGPAPEVLLFPVTDPEEVQKGVRS